MTFSQINNCAITKLSIRLYTIQSDIDLNKNPRKKRRRVSAPLPFDLSRVSIYRSSCRLFLDRTFGTSARRLPAKGAPEDRQLPDDERVAAAGSRTCYYRHRIIEPEKYQSVWRLWGGEPNLADPPPSDPLPCKFRRAVNTKTLYSILKSVHSNIKRIQIKFAYFHSERITDGADRLIHAHTTSRLYTLVILFFWEFRMKVPHITRKRRRLCSHFFFNFLLVNFRLVYFACAFFRSYISFVIHFAFRRLAMCLYILCFFYMQSSVVFCSIFVHSSDSKRDRANKNFISGHYSHIFAWRVYYLKIDISLIN